ncbi:poly(A) polymerase [Jatrophihabitans sp. GAS493]|uniref:CCA tRNA nucleotidyltransferase n=1 Tax=Jatrophihabitans sp. GAS493 TaxID=1907575 RepID=UPI000BB78C74|nr:CCA tRNA nucleotidyltransferase [Jatrophihabitans sp. GAS493]SOD71257.1 poly(A) polymerase [Jatrophihabitans sp. GAS493]
MTPAQGPQDLISIPPVATRLGAAFRAAGFELHLVGGPVRDALMGRPADDLDFTTDARPEQILSVVEPLSNAIWTTGIEFGTVGVQLEGQLLEITTFRADRYDRVSRNPEVAFGDSLRDDLLRRDFTMNAMALSVSHPVGEPAEFSDPFGGLADLARGVLNTPATPEESFADDPLRMLRGARFASTLGVAVAEPVLAAMTEMAPQLARITAERVQVELSKLLLGANPRAGLEVLVDTGLADVVLPELPALRMSSDEHGQHKDVYAHTLQVLEQAIDLETDGPDLVLRWAALLHDIGKPNTRRFEAGGRVTFHHHEAEGARMVRARLRALKFPKEMTENIAELVFLHLRFYGYGRGEWTDSAVRRYVIDAGPLLERLHKLVRSDCTTRNKRKAAALSDAYDELEQRIAMLREQEELDAVRPDLDGNEIMRLLEIPAGPLVGKAYRYLLELRMENGPLSHEDAVSALRSWYAAQA